MREILFRGKRQNDGEWVEGYLVKAVGGVCMILPITTEHCGGAEFNEGYHCDPSTVGQHTGLNDKHGKMIFEGDIVKFTDSPFGYSYIGVVCFNGGGFCIKYKGLNTEIFLRFGQPEKWQDMGASGNVTYQYEILGKVYDNPELLEEVQ